MKAFLCHAFAKPDNLGVEEIEPRRLERGRVRIGVRAAGVTFRDCLTVTGKYQTKRRLPFTPGIEAAGEIVECAHDVSRLSVPVNTFSRSRAVMVPLQRN